VGAEGVKTFGAYEWRPSSLGRVQSCVGGTMTVVAEGKDQLRWERK